MKAFILAGGFATRLWPLTESRAKPLLPLAGKPLLTHIVEKIPADIDVTVSTNAAFADSFKSWKQTITRKNVTIRIEHTKNDDEKLGTLGATAQWIAEEHIDDDILLLTGDNYFGFAFTTFLSRFLPGRALIAAHDIGDRMKATAFGTVILGADGSVQGFEEKPKDPKSSLISTGCSILPKDTLPTLIAYAAIKPDNVGGIFEELLRVKRPIDCFQFTEDWFDIGSFEMYLEATKALVGDQAMMGAGTVMQETQTDGSVVAGAGNTIEHSNLTDTVIFDGCMIEDCVLDRCVIDDGCELRGIDLTGKMIRRNTRLIRKDR